MHQIPLGIDVEGYGPLPRPLTAGRVKLALDVTENDRKIGRLGRAASDRRGLGRPAKLEIGVLARAKAPCRRSISASRRRRLWGPASPAVRFWPELGGRLFDHLGIALVFLRPVASGSCAGCGAVSAGASPWMRFRLLRRLFIRRARCWALVSSSGASRSSFSLFSAFGRRSGLFIKRELLLRRFGRLLLFRRRRLFRLLLRRRGSSAFCCSGGGSAMTSTGISCAPCLVRD